MPGDPNGIADLCGRLRAEAQRIRAVAARLQSVNAGDFWISESANEFASRVGRAAPDLDLTATRIETTATALNRYLQAIGDCQSRGRTAVLRARDAEAELARARAGVQAEADQAAKDLAAAGIQAAQNPGVTPSAPVSAWGPNWKSVLEGAEQARTDALRLFNAAVDDYQQAVRRCISDLGPAVHDALADPHHGVFNRIVHTAESGLNAVAHVGDNVADWVDHHLLTLDGISDTLGIAAAVAAFVPGAEGVALALSATKTALDYGLYLSGDKEWKDVRNDLVGTALFGAGRILIGVSRARTAATATREAVKATEEAAQLGRKIEEAERTARTVDSGWRAGKASAEARIVRFDDVAESLGRGTSRSWWKESGRAFRHLDLEAPGGESLSIDRYARYAAKTTHVIGRYSKTKDAAELVKSAAESVTGEKPEGPIIGAYEIL